MRGPASLLPDFDPKYVPSERDCVIFHEVCVLRRDPVRVGREQQLAATTVRSIAHRAQRRLAAKQYELRLKATDELRLDWLRLEEMGDQAMQGWERSKDEKLQKEVVEDNGRVKKRIRTAPQAGQVGFLRAAERFMLHKRDLTALIEEAERKELAAIQKADYPKGVQPAGAVLAILEQRGRRNQLDYHYAHQPPLTEWEEGTEEAIRELEWLEAIRGFLARLDARGGDPLFNPVPGSEMAELKARIFATGEITATRHAAEVAAGRAEADPTEPLPPGELTPAQRRLWGAFVPRDGEEARLLTSIVSAKVTLDIWKANAAKKEQEEAERKAAREARRAERAEKARAEAERAAAEREAAHAEPPVEAASIAADLPPQTAPVIDSASEPSARERRLLSETETGTIVPVTESPPPLTSEQVPLPSDAPPCRHHRSA